MDTLSKGRETVAKLAEVITFYSGEGEDGLNFGLCWGWVGPDWLRGGGSLMQGCGLLVLALRVQRQKRDDKLGNECDVLKADDTAVRSWV